MLPQSASEYLADRRIAHLELRRWHSILSSDRSSAFKRIHSKCRLIAIYWSMRLRGCFEGIMTARHIGQSIKKDFAFPWRRGKCCLICIFHSTFADKLPLS